MVIILFLGRQHAMRLAIRCARDSMPPLRLAILLDVAAHPKTTTHAVRVRTAKPRATVDRQLQSLHMLGLLGCFEADGDVWRYQLGDEFDLAVLDPPELVPDLSPHGESESKGETPGAYVPPTDKSGTTPGFRPTTLMIRVSNYLSTVDGGVSGSQIESAVEGKPEGVRRALEVLVYDGYVTRIRRHTDGAVLHRHQRLYSELDDHLPRNPPGAPAPNGAAPPGALTCPRCRYPAKRLIPPDGLCPTCAYPGGAPDDDTEED